MRVLLLSKYSKNGASSRLRSFQYVTSLVVNDIDVTVNPLFDETYLINLYSKKNITWYKVLNLYIKRFFILFSAYKYDLLWVEKEIFPYFPAIFERILSLVGIKYVVDFDDAIFHNYDLSNNMLVRLLLKNKIALVISNAEHVIVGNDYLANYARNNGAKGVTIIPTVVDLSRYIVNPKVDGFDSGITLGWIGSPSTQKYLLEIKDVLISMCSKYKINLLFVGASNDLISHFPNSNIQIKAWTEDTESMLISKMDIGLMPLSQGAWEKGKCGYKLIQYMACGIPVIASSIGINVNIVNESECGFLADTENDWTKALEKLVNNKKLRKVLGNNGRLSVESTYSLDVQSKKIISIFNRLAAK